jgi:uncharacterized protein
MIRGRSKRAGRQRSGKRKAIRPRSLPLYKRLAIAGLLCFFGCLFAAIAFVCFLPTKLIDESGRVGNSGIVFEEPNPPAHSPSEIKTSEVENKQPLVAIIIDDMGYHEKIGKELMSLRLHLTFSFLPFAPFTRQQEAAASASGHTVLLHLPMQPEGREWNPGPGALYLGETEALQRKILDTDLSWVPHAVGVNNHMGSLYTQDEFAMQSLLSDLENKGLFFIDSLTTPKSVAYRLALKIGEKTERRQIFLDNIHSEEKIILQLEKLVAEAEHQGRAIGIGHPYPETLQALTASAAKLKKKVRLVGVEELVH